MKKITEMKATYKNLKTHTYNKNTDDAIKTVKVFLNQYDSSKIVYIKNKLQKGGFSVSEVYKEPITESYLTVYNKKEIHNSKFAKKIKNFLEDKGIYREKDLNSNWEVWYANRRRPLKKKMQNLDESFVRILSFKKEYMNNAKKEFNIITNSMLSPLILEINYMNKYQILNSSLKKQTNMKIKLMFSNLLDSINTLKENSDLSDEPNSKEKIEEISLFCLKRIRAANTLINEIIEEKK